jgi:hypothetical protein
MRRVWTGTMLVVGATLTSATYTVAWGQSVTLPTDCEIDLAQNGFAQFVSSAVIPSGSVFTTNATKKCTNSADRQVILLSCNTKIPTWSGGSRSKKNVICKINATECGVEPGGVFTIAKATLSIASDGKAQLTCNLSRNLN